MIYIYIIIYISCIYTYIYLSLYIYIYIYIYKSSCYIASLFQEHTSQDFPSCFTPVPSVDHKPHIWNLEKSYLKGI